MRSATLRPLPKDVNLKVVKFNSINFSIPEVIKDKASMQGIHLHLFKSVWISINWIFVFQHLQCPTWLCLPSEHLSTAMHKGSARSFDLVYCSWMRVLMIFHQFFFFSATLLTQMTQKYFFWFALHNYHDQ